MLAGEWAGDFVCFLGDYADFHKSKSPAAKRALEALNGYCTEDYLLECCEDIQGRFDYAKTNPDFRWYDFEEGEYKPFTGPFDIAIQRVRYQRAATSACLNSGRRIGFGSAEDPMGLYRKTHRVFRS